MFLTYCDFKKIWEMQGELNALVGVPTLDIMKLPGVPASAWMMRFAVEAVNEVVEAQGNMYHKWWSEEVKTGEVAIYTVRDRAKLLVELIDILHFLMSAVQVSHSGDWDRFTYITLDKIERLNKRPITSDAELFMRLTDTMRMLLDHRFPAALNALGIMFGYLCVSAEEVVNIYTAKWEANKKRHANKYSVDGKTEADNEVIEDDIKEGRHARS